MNNTKKDSDGKPYPPTTSSKRFKDEKGVSWSNYQGTKESREVKATQLNSKTKDGMHTFYSPASGRQGAAFDERKK